MRILGPPSADRATVLANVTAATGVHARFVADMFPALWWAGLACGVDPVGMVAQSFKETGGGQYAGKVKPEFFNPCGLKVGASLFPGVDDGDNPLAHARFPNWQVGALAHAQHLAAYAGVVLPTLIVDPRYELVVGVHRVETFEDLSGKWAPAATYGSDLVKRARKLQTPAKEARP
jgi:hypothetical protein